MTVLANYFSKDGIDVALITSYPCEREYALNKKVRRINLESTKINDSFLKRNIRRVCLLRRVLNQYKPDALIAFMAEPNLRALVATIGTGIPTIVSVRNDPSREYGSKLFRIAAKILFRRASWVVFQTDEAQKWFSSSIRDKSSIILNPVSDVFFETQRRPEHGLIVTCGRLTEQKNQAMLLKAFAQIVDAIPDAYLEIYGEGELRSKLKEQIIELGLENRALLKGYADEVPSILSRASVFALSSNYEGLSNALLEAMAVGVPSVVTDCPCGGARMLIDQGVTGLLTEVNNTEEFAYSLRLILSNRDLADELSANAREKAKGCTAKSIAKEWYLLLESVVNNS